MSPPRDEHRPTSRQQEPGLKCQQRTPKHGVILQCPQTSSSLTCQRVCTLAPVAAYRETPAPRQKRAVLPRSASWGGNAACSPHSRAAPGPPSSSLPSVGPSPVCPCPSCSAGSRTGRDAPGAAPQVLSRGSPSCNQRQKAPISFLPAFQPPRCHGAHIRSHSSC